MPCTAGSGTSSDGRALKGLQASLKCITHEFWHLCAILPSVLTDVPPLIQRNQLYLMDDSGCIHAQMP
jgi:hypothetical protein